MQTKLRQITITIIATTLVIGGTILAGTLIPDGDTNTPTMYTLSDIYNKLNLNTYSASTHTVSTTSLPTTGTMRTLTEIWDKIPTITAATIATGTTVMGIPGNITIPAEADVRLNTTFGANKALTGAMPEGYAFGSSDASKVLSTAGAGAGTANTPPGAGVAAGPDSVISGYYAFNVNGGTITGAVTLPAQSNVKYGVTYGWDGELVGSMNTPPETGSVANASTILSGAYAFNASGAVITGAYDPPSVSDVRLGTQFGWGGEDVGNITIPAEADVRLNTTYGSSLSLTGQMEAGAATEWSAQAPGNIYNWAEAGTYCAGLDSTGGTKDGMPWRLPSPAELIAKSGRDLYGYWSGTTVSGVSANAYNVFMSTANSKAKTQNDSDVLCAR